MADSRNFTALDWVTGEINETLTQARQALEAYVVNQEDPTQMRFCLTYLHQVYGILQMVEFHGGALLAEELEKLAQALVDRKVPSVQEACEILMRAILQLPVYLEKVKTSRRDDPASLLPLLNDLRAVRGGALLTESAVFSPDMTAARKVVSPKANLSEEKFLDAAKKLRQLYQAALLNIIKEKDYDSSLPRLEKVFSNFEKICQGTRYQPLWQISLALIEGLMNDSISAGVAINNLLREIEKVIKYLALTGKPGLDTFEAEELIKNLLYYVAGSRGETPRIRVIRDVFKLDSALPGAESDESSIMAGVDPDAMRSVVVALSEEFTKIKEVFDNYVAKKEENNDALKRVLPVFKQSADTLAVLGQGHLRKIIEKLAVDLALIADQPQLISSDNLMDAAAKLLEVEGSLNSQFNKDAKDKQDGAPPSMDIAMLTAQETVLFECQNGLEQAKDAIVEFIASQWDIKHVEPLPKLLMEIRGSLEMVNQRRCARILGACSRYIKDKLISGNHQPDWQEMDTLADAIAGVEYYLETLDQDVVEEEDTVLAVAEESVANLGYAVAAPRKAITEAEATEEFSTIDTLDIAALDEIIVESELEESSDAELIKRGPALTKEKLAEILGGDASKKETEERAAKEAEAAAKRSEKQQRATATKAPDEGPLLSDDEFNSIQTSGADFEIETEFNFDALAGNRAGESKSPAFSASSGDDYGVIDFESAPSPQVEASTEQSTSLELEGIPDFALTEPESIEIKLPEMAIADVESAEVDLGDVKNSVTAQVEDPGELIVDDFETDFDDEIAEIFIEEIQEVLTNIHEFYPQWKNSNFSNIESLKEFRRGFHTMKGSGRMAKARSVGELAWSVENMLNRVMDGTFPADSRHCELIERVLEKIPSMMEAFQHKQADPDPRLSRRYRLIGEALSKGEEPLPFVLSRDVGVLPEIEALAVAEAPPEALDSVEPDWDLWDIFVAEAESHLEVVSDWIVHAQSQAPLPVDPTDPLQRALHTLKGSAYMAELKAIGDLATPLEKFVKALRAFQIQVGESFTQLLVDCVDEIRCGLQQINAREMVSLENTVGLHRRINAMRLELTGESEEDIESELTGLRKVVVLPGAAKVDPARWNRFLEGEIDALMDAADLLDLWQSDASDQGPVLRLVAELQKMADAAEPAGLMPVASLCRLMIQAYQKVLGSNSLGQTTLLPLLLNGHECLINFIDELAGGQNIQEQAQLESQLKAFIGEAVQFESSPTQEVYLETEQLTEAEEPSIQSVEIEKPSLSTPIKFESVNPADFDTELLGIFLEEATELLDELDGVIAAWHDDPTDKTQADGLKRILHTYKGGARMAGLGVLGTLAHDLETQLETFSGTADSALFSQVHDYQDRLIQGTERARQLMGGESVRFDDLASFGDVAISEALVQSSAELEYPDVNVIEEQADEEIVIDNTVNDVVAESFIEESPVVTAQPALGAGEILEYSADIDPELLGIFIDEAGELLEDLERSIADWQQEPADSRFVDALKRTLHTLKGGARMAGMTGLGTLAHDLETWLETFTGTADAALFAMLQDYQDKIIRGVDQTRALAAGETPQAVVSKNPAQSMSTEQRTSSIELADDEDISDVSTRQPSEPVAAVISMERTAEILPFKSVALPKGLDPQADKRAAAERAAKDAAPQEMVKISAELVDQLVNLAGETSISRGRVEQQVIDFALTLNDVEGTIKRLQDLLRRMEIETETQVQSKTEEMRARKDDFDPLEMDHYSTLQQLTRSLMETSSDLIDLRSQLTNKARETEMILLQQSRINTELQEGLMRSRMVPFSRMVPRLRRIVRQVSGELKKEVDFDLVNIEGEMDRTVLERMVAPLEHMLRNALDHGIEIPSEREKAGKSRRGRVVLSFGREGGDVVITLKDDGGGIPVDKVRKKAIERGLITEQTQLTDHEVLQFIMQAGFSTAEKVTQISGRGVGMDVVHSEIKQLGGTMSIHSQVGLGSEFVVRLPFTVSVNRALMVRIGDDLFAVPLNSIEGIVRVSPFELENYYQDRDARFEYAGELYEVRYLGKLLHTKDRPVLDGLVLPESVILVRGADHSIALHVDQLLGSKEIVVKSLGPQFGNVPGLSGATILGDGSVVVILDLMALVRATILLESQSSFLHTDTPVTQAIQKQTFTVMVVDDSVTVRKVTSRFLEREGFEVILAKDGADAMLQLQDVVPDIMLLDIEMPRMDGFEVASSVKNADRLKKIPIIMITSRTGEKHRERAMSIGVERYMGKPFVEEELLETINQLLAEKLRHRAAAE